MNFGCFAIVAVNGLALTFNVRARYYVFFLVIILPAVLGAKEFGIQGYIVDSTGKPTVGANIDSFWSANGIRSSDVTALNNTKNDEELRTYWTHVGEMVPFKSEHSCKSDIDGSFKLTIDDDCHAVMAIDRLQKTGGIAILRKGREEEPIEIRLLPLIHVQGTLKCVVTNKAPYWSHVYISVPSDPERPLDCLRLVSCGSFDGQFEFELPAGPYVLNAYGESIRKQKEDIDVRAIPDLTLTLRPSMSVVDLGALQLVPSLSLDRRKDMAQLDGTWGDYTKHYGETPPNWHVTDALGVNKDVNVADFKGKWLLIDFWAMNCPPCLGENLPRLMKFYDEHEAQRKQFEIVSICVDVDGELEILQ